MCCELMRGCLSSRKRESSSRTRGEEVKGVMGSAGRLARPMGALAEIGAMLVFKAVRGAMLAFKDVKGGFELMAGKEVMFVEGAMFVLMAEKGAFPII